MLVEVVVCITKSKSGRGAVDTNPARLVSRKMSPPKHHRRHPYDCTTILALERRLSSCPVSEVMDVLSHGLLDWESLIKHAFTPKNQPQPPSKSALATQYALRR